MMQRMTDYRDSLLAVVKVVETAWLWKLFFWLRAFTVYTVPLCRALSWCSTARPDTITVTVTLGTGGGRSFRAHLCIVS